MLCRITWPQSHRYQVIFTHTMRENSQNSNLRISFYCNMHGADNFEKRPFHLKFYFSSPEWSTVKPMISSRSSACATPCFNPSYTSSCANSDNSDETSHNTAFHQSPHCLLDKNNLQIWKLLQVTTRIIHWIIHASNRKGDSIRA